MIIRGFGNPERACAAWPMPWTRSPRFPKLDDSFLVSVPVRVWVWVGVGVGVGVLGSVWKLVHGLGTRNPEHETRRGGCGESWTTHQ